MVSHCIKGLRTDMVPMDGELATITRFEIYNIIGTEQSFDPDRCGMFFYPLISTAS